jgi:hypothetical protein
VHDRVDLVLGENFFDLGADTKIDLAEDGGGRDGSAMTFLQVI